MGEVFSFVAARNRRLHARIADRLVKEQRARDRFLASFQCAFVQEVGEARATDYVLVEESLNTGDKLFYFVKRKELGV